VFRVTARRGAHGERAAGPAPPLARLPPRSHLHSLSLLVRLAAAGARGRRQRGAPAHHQHLRARARVAYGRPLAFRRPCTETTWHTQTWGCA